VFEDALDENKEFLLGRAGIFPPFSIMTESRMPAGVEIRFGGEEGSAASADQPLERNAMFAMRLSGSV